MAKQELMDPKMVNAIREYEATLAQWGALRDAEQRGVTLCGLLAVPLWLISFWASTQTGPVNQASWFTFFTVASFLAAGGLSFVAVVGAIVKVTQTKPVKPVVYEKIERTA